MASSAMEPKHDIKTGGNSDSHSPVSVMGDDVTPNSKTLSSPVSFCNYSPDSTLDGPFGEDGCKKPDNCTGYTYNLPTLDKANESHLGNSEKPVSGSYIQSETTQNPSRSSSGNLSTTESPSTQVMERSTNKAYRIPSSVFATDKSTNPAEWSVTSNESLFSIHMGTMSFSKDASFWHSGDLGTPRDFSASPLCEFSAMRSSHELGIAELEVSRETEDLNRKRSIAEVEVSRETEDLNPERSITELEVSREDLNRIIEGRISHISTESGTSTKSFAFPILAGAVDKQYSVRMDTSVKQIPEQKKQPQVEPETEADAEEVPPSEPKTPAATKKGGKNKGFSCFSCCSFCS